jgi:hypothetical protein
MLSTCQHAYSMNTIESAFDTRHSRCLHRHVQICARVDSESHPHGCYHETSLHAYRLEYAIQSQKQSYCFRFLHTVRFVSVCHKYFLRITNRFSTATLAAILRLVTRIHDRENSDATSVGWIGCFLDILENPSAIISSSLPLLAFMISRFEDSRFGCSVQRLLSVRSRSSLRSASGSEQTPKTSLNLSLHDESYTRKHSHRTACKI